MNCERNVSVKKKLSKTKHPHTNSPTNSPCNIRQDVSHLNLTEFQPNFPEFQDIELSEANAMLACWNLLCLSIVLATAGLVTTSSKARSCLCFCLERLSRAHSSMRTRMKKKARQFEKSRESRGLSLIFYIEGIFLALISFWSLTIAIL